MSLADMFEKSIWRPYSVEDEPTSPLTSWQVMLVHDVLKGDTVHLIGWAQYEGRVSSAIQSFDIKSGVGISMSGRRYELVGGPGIDGDAVHTFNRWLQLNGRPTFTDVTADYVGDRND